MKHLFLLMVFTALISRESFAIHYVCDLEGLSHGKIEFDSKGPKLFIVEPSGKKIIIYGNTSCERFIRDGRDAYTMDESCSKSLASLSIDRNVKDGYYYERLIDSGSERSLVFRNCH